MTLVRSGHAHVVVNFATGAAGAGVSHLPEIIFCAELVDAIFGNALTEPQVVSFRVARHSVFAFENGDVELVLLNTKPLR